MTLALNIHRSEGLWRNCSKVNALAAELGQFRAAIINVTIYRAVAHGLLKE